MEELKVTKKMLEEHLEELRKSGLSENSLVSYRIKFKQLYDLLPEDKIIRQGTIEALGEKMRENGYSPASINVFFAAADGFVAHYGSRSLQTTGRLAKEQFVRPELTRNEYRRLLSTAKVMGHRRTYFLIKTFAVLGVTPRDLQYITVESINAGGFERGNETVYIPTDFQKELQAFAEAERIYTGPVFLGRDRRPIRRTTINNMILRVQRVAQVPEEKCTPRCLQMLYRKTQEELDKKAKFMVEQEYNRMLQIEDSTLAWGHR